MKRCKQPRCRRWAIKHRNICHRCRKRLWRKLNPLAAAFAVRRDKAKRRGIQWCLTLEEFKEFCNKTDLLALQGNEAHSLTIDRIDNTKPYTVDNIQPLTRSQNTEKQNQYDECRNREGYAKRTRSRY